jgi:hypothetical protein
MIDFRRDAGDNLGLPKVLDAAFAQPQSDDESQIKALVHA